MVLLLNVLAALRSVLGFASGVGATLAGAFIANALTVQRERQARIRDKQFDAYMLLLELNGQYFWVASFEMRGEELPAEVASKCHDLAWRIADLLRSADDMPFLDETLEMLLGSSYATANARANAFDVLTTKWGDKVNPKYAKAIRAVSQGNMVATFEGRESNAPGSLGGLRFGRRRAALKE